MIMLDTRMMTPVSLMGEIATISRHRIEQICRILAKATFAFPADRTFHRKLERFANIGAAVINEIVNGETWYIFAAITATIPPSSNTRAAGRVSSVNCS